MAVTNVLAEHLQDGQRPRPAEDTGKLRVIYAEVNQGAAAGDATSTWEIAKLPPGKVIVWPHLCKYRVDALGAARVMDIGHRAYISRGDAGQTTEAEDEDAFALNIDVSGATNAAFPATGGVAYEMWSAQGITLYASVAGGTIPANATGEFVIVYSDMN